MVADHLREEEFSGGEVKWQDIQEQVVRSADVKDKIVLKRREM